MSPSTQHTRYKQDVLFPFLLFSCPSLKKYVPAFHTVGKRDKMQNVMGHTQETGLQSILEKKCLQRGWQEPSSRKRNMGRVGRENEVQK